MSFFRKPPVYDVEGDLETFKIIAGILGDGRNEAHILEVP
jgi:hypothetical protein